MFFYVCYITAFLQCLIIRTNHSNSSSERHVFPEDFGYTEGQNIYIFCAFGRWAVIAEGLIVFQENREWEKSAESLV